MVNIINIVTIIQFTVLSIVILLTLIYSFSLVLLQRFRHRLHIFTINVCASILCCSIYWLTNYVMIQTNVVQYYNIKTCSLVYYAQTMCTLQVVLAMIVVSIHRLCYVVYHNNIFLKSKKWTLMCVVCQWLVGMVMSLPAFIRSGPICVMASWMQYYTLAIIIVIPISICMVMNIIIFKYVQSSTRRILPVQVVVSTHHRSNHKPTLSRRDVHLLRHMVIMFFVFIIGWCPIYITAVITTQISVNILTIRILSLLAELSLLCDIIDLFLYSHELRKQLRRVCFPCYYN